jgi:hypothetical protein
MQPGDQGGTIARMHGPPVENDFLVAMSRGKDEEQHRKEDEAQGSRTPVHGE